LEKSEFPFSSETENFHWLKGDKNVIILTTADHDCVQERFAVVAVVITDMCSDSRSGLF